jgi:hypothetical protein
VDKGILRPAIPRPQTVPAECILPVYLSTRRLCGLKVSVSPTSNKMHPLLALLHSDLEVPQNHSLPLPQSCLAREVGLIWTLQSSDMSLAFPTRAT